MEPTQIFFRRFAREEVYARVLVLRSARYSSSGRYWSFQSRTRLRHFKSLASSARSNSSSYSLMGTMTETALPLRVTISGVLFIAPRNVYDCIGLYTGQHTTEAASGAMKSTPEIVTRNGKAVSVIVPI